MRVFSQDESRFGLLTIRRRRLTARGVQPVGTIQHVFQWFYVYGAVAPTTGEHFFLELPYLNAANFQIFVDAFAQAYPDSLNILVLDKSGAHTAHRLKLPDNVRLVFLPPYCPELNPIERLWRDLKDDQPSSNSLMWHSSAKPLRICSAPMMRRPFNRLPVSPI